MFFLVHLTIAIFLSEDTSVFRLKKGPLVSYLFDVINHIFINAQSKDGSVQTFLHSALFRR